MTETVNIRPGVRQDLPKIVDIYNYYVANTHITFDVAPIDVNNRIPWFDDFSTHERYQLFVAEAGNALLGYAHARALKPKAAYETSVEVTVYLAPDIKIRGLGSRLYQALFDALEKLDVHRAYGVIALPNEASIALHLKFGFQSLHTQSEVGRKFGRYYDVQWFEKKL